MVVEYPHDAKWNLDAYAAHAAKAMDEAHRYILIAESFSGPVALRLRNDARVAAIVLVASFVRRPNPALACLPLLPLGLARRIASRRGLLRMFCLGGDAPDDRLDALADRVRALPTTILRARLALLRDLDEHSCLRDARMPALHLRARRDRLVRSAISDGGLAGDQFREAVIDGPHFLLQARPEACWSMIEDWLVSTGVS